MKIKLTGTDAIQIRESGKVFHGAEIIDMAPDDVKQLAHRDGMQFIPARPGKMFNTQFAGAMVDNVTINKSSIKSDGKLQCIFCSDGGITNANITDNTLQTNGQHFISLSLLSGHIANNRDENGQLVPIRLFPMRIGGNSDGQFNVYILTFKNDQYRYDPVEDIVNDDTLDHVTDHRFGYEKRDNSIYLYNFDLDGFIAATEQRQHSADEMRELALSFGTQEPEASTAQQPTTETVMTNNPNHRRMSDSGVKTLIESEGAIPHVYVDQAGYKTLGVGHLLLPSELMSGKITLYTGQVIDFRQPISQDEITALLKHDLRSRCTGVENAVKVELNQGQFDTLVHFVFNIGLPAFLTSSLLRELNKGDYSCVPTELRKWNKITVEVNGVPVKRVSEGLINRRETAVGMWCAATPEVFDIDGYIAGGKNTSTGPIYDAPVATAREMKGIDKPEKTLWWSRITWGSLVGLGGTGGMGGIIATMNEKISGLANEVINDPVSATGEIAKDMQDASVNAAKLLDAANDLNIWLMWAAIFVAIAFAGVIVALLARLDDRAKGIN